MAETEGFGYHPSGFRDTEASGEECADGGPMKMLDLYLTGAEDFLKAVKELSPRTQFNTEQCEYLVHKLEVAVQSGSCFLETSLEAHHGLLPFWDIGRIIDVFKLLLAYAEHTESFIQGCCKDEWIQAAMKLSNVSAYVSWIGFNLKLCETAFCKNSTGTGSLTLDEVEWMNTTEVEAVVSKAFADMDILFEKVVSKMPFLSSIEKDLAIYLIHRIKGIKPISLADLLEPSFRGELRKRLMRAKQLIGRGDSSVVHKALWLGIPVAEKTFYGRENPDFKNQVEILGGLCHPNVTFLYCTSMNGRSCSFVMELMDEDLYSMMQRRLKEDTSSPPFSILEALDIMLQIGEGVNYIHNKSIVHMDLKSMNILVKSGVARKSESGYVNAKVTDFGLSKIKDHSTTYSIETYNVGSSRWMSPEVIRVLYEIMDLGRRAWNEKPPTDPFKCDVFSFAMLCYEILTGDMPFCEETNPNSVKQKIIRGVRPDLPEHCPRQLKYLIERCWSQEPSKRPSFAEICLELKYLKSLLMTDISFSRDSHFTNEESFEEPVEEKPVKTSTGDRVITSAEFLIGPQLGRGASATVHEVVWQGCKYAMKTFYGLNVPEFEKEVSILRGRSHPNIVSFHHWGESKRKRSCYIVMDLMDKSLFHFMREDCDSPPFTIPEAVNIMLQVGHGVNYMHQNKIVHRDLKSENILLKRVKRGNSDIEDLLVKVADFGLAVIKEQSRRASDLLSVGTGRWMAPEIMTLTPGTKISPPHGGMNLPFKCDVYSFAIVCSEILTGELPFSTFDATQIKSLKQVVVGKGLRPRLPADCPTELKALIEKCWHKQPSMRPKFDEICKELERLQASLVLGNVGEDEQTFDAATSSAGKSTIWAQYEHNKGIVRSRSKTQGGMLP